MQNLRVVITKIDVEIDLAGVVTKNEIQYQAYAPDDKLLIAGTETDLVHEGMDADELQSIIDSIAYQRWLDYQNNLSRAERIQSTVVDLNVLINQDITVAVPDIPASPTIVQANDKITITADGETAIIEILIEDVSQTDPWDGTPIEKILGEGDFTVAATAINVRGGRSASAVLHFSYIAS
ncbi:hypothetical protein IH992_22315 [Candidatus Poribacteria bacterium]|nr:hypothetical protein [Candidatus Poribacteria bacterium]